MVVAIEKGFVVVYVMSWISADNVSFKELVEHTIKRLYTMLMKVMYSPPLPLLLSGSGR